MRQDGESGESEPAEPVSLDPGLPLSADSPEPVVDNRLFVLVLQHPQERSEPRATAAATVATLRRARLVVGLSWPNLARALGRPTDPRRWGVLYLGSARPLPAPKPHDPTHAPERPQERSDAGEIIALGHGGDLVPAADRMLHSLEGIVLLDGTWSQAKTLWWRNPWLLKLQRLVLNPPEPARIGRLRREPRREALSTLEAASFVLRRTEPGPEAADALLAALDRLIAACGGRPGPVSGGDTDLSPGRFLDPFSGRRRRYRGRSAAE